MEKDAQKGQGDRRRNGCVKSKETPCSGNGNENEPEIAGGSASTNHFQSHKRPQTRRKIK